MRLKPFSTSEDDGELNVMPPPPHLDVIYEADMLRQQPSVAMILEKGDKAQPKPPTGKPEPKNPNEYHFNGYTQLILFCIIESKARKIKEYEAANLKN